MAYRYTNTDKWEKDSWFIDLTPVEKLLFIYLCETCDIAGFKEISYRKIKFDLGIDEDQIKGAMEGLSRGLKYSLDGSILFVRNFIKQQKNLPLKPENNAHIGIVRRLTENLDKFGFSEIGNYFFYDK